MRSRYVVLAILTAASFVGPPAIAQTDSSSNSSSQFVTQETDSQWRASKLIGLSVYDPQNQKVGSIREILVSKEGNPEVAVIGVGGFLGIGAKDVGLPFKALKWSNERVTPPAPSGGTTGAGGAAPGSATMARGAPARANAKPDYPDHAVLEMTKEQLKSAPDFKFAEAASQGPAGGAPASGKAR